MPTQFDMVIIGAGPAGEGCAMRAAKQGKRVAVVDDKSGVGGNCAHLGTIPSKALRHSVRQIIRFNTDRMFRVIGEPKLFSFPQVLKRAEEIIQKQVDVRTTFYARNRINLYHGSARFTDANTVEVVAGEGLTETLKAEHVVICTGSRPYRPADIDFDDSLIFDSDSILKLDNTPRKIIIFGAGVIGCEYASIFCGLGVRVELIDSRPRLLEFLDHEISDALSYHLRDQGAVIRHTEKYSKITSDGKHVYVDLESGKRLRAEALLWCNGRSGNTDRLNLEELGVKVNSRGQLIVDDHYRTSLEHIYGAGDVVGWPSLASAAYDQGRCVGSAITQKEDFYFVEDVPTGIYTLPEISSLGKTEQELTAEQVPYDMGQAFFKTLARAQISGETVGMLKLLFHRETLQILGIHCFGDQAAEIVHIGQAIMNQSGDANTIEYFVKTTFNYPTMAEAYRVAALNGLHRVM